MGKYRIVQGEGYSGCIPITVWWVQMRVPGFFCDKWRNVKGFEDRKKAKELLKTLE